MKKIKIKINSTEIKALHLKNFCELMTGLMFRKEGDALLEFKKEGKYGIWMVFMRFPVDLVFLDKNKKIVDLIKNVPPLSFNPKTWKIYYPEKKCKYVLELDARKRIRAKNGVKISIIS